ncbi:LicD family protein [Leucobacter sp. NPDC058333]|uniref:class I SAM-dependent methyltransferase n=1 Tax=Leucobacter sp. NPDC058333 TaxID=3346450 RepID=UPI00364ED47C
MKSTPRHLVLSALPERTASVDVRFDDVRIWSIDVRDVDTPAEVEWPESLLPRLTGSTVVSVHDSETGALLSEAEVAFNQAPHRTVVVDDTGTPLVVNKWGRLGVAIDAMGAEVQALIVERSAILIEQLRELRLRPFVVGGTLLGAVRDGRLLPHDDDADLAYLSRHTHPVDVAIEAFRIGHALAELGYEVKRHSATHMQLIFRDEDRKAVVHYIDVFAAFFSDDGIINQPFHVRGEMTQSQMLPFSEVTITGVVFPAPADTDRWLTINYDENWRTPIPGFVLETPENTRRRFDSWFGAFNFQRDFWDAHYSSTAAATYAAVDAQWELGREWLLATARQTPSAVVLDLGSGAGALTRALNSALAESRVIGLDYSSEAFRRASSFATSAADFGEAPASGGTPEYAHVNLYRAQSLAIPLELGISGSFDVVANHTLEQIGHLARGYAWRLMRMALRSGGRAAFTFHSRHARDVTIDDPTGWHLEEAALVEEAETYGLIVEFDAIHEPLPKLTTGAIETMPLARAETFARRSRRPIGAHVRLASEHAPNPSPASTIGGSA